MADSAISEHKANLELETAMTYKIGKTTVFIDRIFQAENAETLGEILVKLIKKEVEKP